jgi:uncharacterized protein
MNSEERQLISDLFQRMRSYGAPDKDRDAEALINQQIRANPDAPYMLVQSVLVQEQALEAANARVQELEEYLRSIEESSQPRGGRSGGFLGGFWGNRGGEEPRSSVPQVGARATPSVYDRREDGRSPWAQSPPPAQAQPAPAASGGGFMRSALATAAGVAGGVLVADSLRNMLGGGAHASPSSHQRETPADDARYADERDNDPGTERASYEDDGNDPGFDSGGDEIEI